MGVVWTRAALDREERPTLLVPLVVGDAGWPSLTATVTLTLHVADVNDNPMAPAAKTVTVHTLQVRPSTRLAAQTLNTPCRSDPPHTQPAAQALHTPCRSGPPHTLLHRRLTHPAGQTLHTPCRPDPPHTLLL